MKNVRIPNYPYAKWPLFGSRVIFTLGINNKIYTGLSWRHGNSNCVLCDINGKLKVFFPYQSDFIKIGTALKTVVSKLVVQGE